MSIPDKVAKGYAISARKAGKAFTLYRPASATSVIDAGNIQQATFYALLSVDGNFTKPNKYGNAVWQSFHDTRLARVGDYLKDASSTFFIASQQYLLPPQAVECNAILSIKRPNAADGVGALSYHGATPAGDTALMTGWPASALMDRSDQNDMRLPLDVKRPRWKILMPAFTGVVLRTSDQITDSVTGRRFAIDTAELTDFGWRITAVQLEA